MPIHKWLFSLISWRWAQILILEIPQCIPAVKIFARLELNETISFMDGLVHRRALKEGNRVLGSTRLKISGTQKAKLTDILSSLQLINIYDIIHFLKKPINGYQFRPFHSIDPSRSKEEN